MAVKNFKFQEKTGLVYEVKESFEAINAAKRKAITGPMAN